MKSSHHALGVPSRETPFILRHPFTQSKWTLSTGHSLGRPFRVYEADMSVIVALSDPEAARSMLQRTSRQPILLGVGGAELAVTRLYVVRYVETDAGPYDEFVLGFDTTDKGAEPVRLTDVNELTTVTTRPTYRIHVDDLLLSVPAGRDQELPDPIRVGREVWDMNKKPGELTFASEGDTKRFRVSEGGEPLLSGHFSVDASTMRLPLTEYGFGQSSQHVGSTTRHQTDGLFWAPAVIAAPAAGVTVEGGSSPLGVKLRRLSPQMVFLLNDPCTQFTIDDE